MRLKFLRIIRINGVNSRGGGKSWFEGWTEDGASETMNLVATALIVVGIIVAVALLFHRSGYF